MTPDRFQTLAEAYGGVIGRWPEETRDEAYACLAAAPEAAARALAAARDLDEALDGAPSPSPSRALRERILATAPTARPARAAVWRWLTGAGVGLGLATAAAAGIVIGVDLSAASAGEDAMLVAAAYDSGLLGDGEDAS